MKIKIILILIIGNHDTFGSLGCMDNSYHMEKPYDMKNYHYVHCDCPCQSIGNTRGKCRKCLHYGAPFRGELNGLQLLDQIFR